MYDELIERLRETSCGAENTLWWQAADAIEELQGKAKVLEKLANHWCEAVPKWIPVTERLPLRGDAVLCVGDNGIGVADFVCGNKWCALPWFYVDGEQETNVTHWMPLPAPPKEEI